MTCSTDLFVPPCPLCQGRKWYRMPDLADRGVAVRCPKCDPAPPDQVPEVPHAEREIASLRKAIRAAIAVLEREPLALDLGRCDALSILREGLES